MVIERSYFFSLSTLNCGCFQKDLTIYVIFVILLIFGSHICFFFLAKILLKTIFLIFLGIHGLSRVVVLDITYGERIGKLRKGHVLLSLM